MLRIKNTIIPTNLQMAKGLVDMMHNALICMYFVPFLLELIESIQNWDVDYFYGPNEEDAAGSRISQISLHIW